MTHGKFILLQRQKLPSPFCAGASRLIAALPSRGAARPLPIDLGTVFWQSATAIAITDAGLHIVAANPAYAQLTGCTPFDCIGTLPPGAHPDAVDGAAREVSCPQADGHTRTAWMSLASVCDADGALQCHVATLMDISPLARERQALHHLAQHDPLTQLPNRRLLAAELERSVARARRHGQRLAVLFVDLDHFKWVNDTLGHEAGDALLQEVGCRLRTVLRAEDLVARWGGDEFIVVLDDPADAGAAVRTAGLLLKAIERGVHAARTAVHVSACIGVAMYPDDALAPTELVRLADAAMYRAKQQGSARVALAGQG